jgi:hypothetical protein
MLVLLLHFNLILTVFFDSAVCLQTNGPVPVSILVITAANRRDGNEEQMTNS